MSAGAQQGRTRTEARGSWTFELVETSPNVLTAKPGQSVEGMICKAPQRNGADAIRVTGERGPLGYAPVAVTVDIIERARATGRGRLVGSITQAEAGKVSVFLQWLVREQG